MNEFSVRKLSKVVYGDEEVVSKYCMLRPHSGTDRPFNLFAGAHKSHTECSAVRYGGGGTELASAAAYTCATPPSTNSSIPVIRRMRETTALAISSGVPNLPRGTVLDISFFCCSPTSEEGCRSLNPGVSMEPGSPRSHECGVCLNQLSMSARTNAHNSRLLRSGSGGRQALRL